ncbi:uncharacterized protein LOC141644341 [Silene latifolia]|uniref:uncharacterized protein LOC141644341 n=1 Tax=Silene latifolia TaxID=37657 RepID=UPI003D76A764
MEVRKRLTAMAEVDPPHHHRYPTRWKFGRHAAHSSVSSHPQDKAIVPRLAPCMRNLISQDKAIVAQLAPSKLNKRLKCILYLPSEIIFNILLLVPAKILHQVVRYVCKQWNDVVNDPRFIKAHYQSSSAGLLIQNPIKLHYIYYIEGDNSTKIAFPFRARIYGSINGLVLFHDLTNLQIISVINPLTKVKINLPPVHGLKALISSIGFAITSCGHYKVVVTVCDEDHSPKRHVIVFTLGIDKAWRLIDLRGNSEMECLPTVIPRFIAGMLCWCSFSYPCFAMDIDTETIYHLPKPDNFSRWLQQSSFISLGVGLGIIQEQIDGAKWRLWKLTDIKAGKWTGLAGIKINEILSTVRKELFPRDCRYYNPVMLIDDIFWFYYIVDGEYAVFRFNLANQRFVFFPVKYVFDCTELRHHVHTLLSPKKCYP